VGYFNMPSVIRPDAFNPTLIASPPVATTTEQMEYVRQVLTRACSDSRFAEKAFFAIVKIIAGNDKPIPEITSLNPSSVNLGEPSFDIHVMGRNFTEESVIVFNGYVEPTTFVSSTELTTIVNMTVWAAPAILPVQVLTDDIQSDPLMFEFVDPAPGLELEDNRNFESSRKIFDDWSTRIDHTILNPNAGKDLVDKR
jgi:hypothetical protein